MFALVDCNNFYASCEIVFNPKLDAKPLVILSNNDGCVIARSQKAKDLGIEMGEPAFKLKEQVEHGEIYMLSSNFTLYADMSERVMQTLTSFSPEMEIYSIDEAFFILEDENEEALVKKAEGMRRQVKQWTGIPCSIGIAKTKTLAKMANKIAKREKREVFALISSQVIEERLAKWALSDIWGIGAALTERLKRSGIYTALALKEAREETIQKLIGLSGLHTAFELKGISCIELLDEEKKKSIVVSRSFAQKVEEYSYLQEAIASFATRAAEKLRAQESLAGFLSVFISTSPFSAPYESRSCHVQIPNPTAYTPDLIAIAKEGLSKIYRSGFGYKKAGVLLSDFADKGTEQLDLFTKSENQKKKEKAMEMVDWINRRFDKFTLRFAAEGIEQQPWQSSRAKSSPKFTTSWHELLKIK